MKKNLIQLFLFFILFSCGDLVKKTNELIYLSNTIEYTGICNGENLHFSAQNSCVQQIIINNIIVRDSLNYTDFEIDFKKFGIKTGDSVLVKILLSDKKCELKCLNEEVLYKLKK